jgi:xylulokinase
VVAGGLDQSCAALGLGVVDTRTTGIGTGSVEAVALPLETTESLLEDAEHFLSITPYAPGGFLGMALSYTAGSAIEWLRDLLGCASPDDLLPAGLAEPGATIEPSRLMFVPQFAGAFAPRRDRGARALLSGLSLDTSAADIGLALLEGLVFELRRTVETIEEAGLRVSALRNGGRGAASAPWVRLKASVLGQAIDVPEVTDSSCLGAALLAAVADGRFTDCAEAAAAMVHVARRYEPEPAIARRYDDRYKEYCALRDAAMASPA